MALFAHGVGHLLFLANSWGYWKGDEEGRSWLFSGVLGAGQTLEGTLGLVWLIPLIGFVAVSWGYLAQQGWWPQLALASAAISLAMIVAWWGGLITGSAFFALVFDSALGAWRALRIDPFNARGRVQRRRLWEDLARQLRGR
jgi:hypothetical protein